MTGGGLPRLVVAADGCATVTLQRPEHRNRLHREDLLALQSMFSQLAADPTVRLLVLTATGPSFCAGFHLGELGQDGAGKDSGGSAKNSAKNSAGHSAATDPQLFEHTVDALEALPLPSIARLNGSVYGGATDLALACDFRIGVAGMELRMPAARLGLHYYPSGLQRYVTRLGLQTAKRLFMRAEAVGAEELLRIGYLDELATADTLDAAMQACTQALLAGAPLALRGMKQSLNEIARGAFDLAPVAARVAQCAVSEDLREGLAAFAAKRVPRFLGR